MEKYITSLELSKKLKAAGYLQNTQYYWYVNHLSGNVTLKFSDHNHKWTNADTAAPLSDELLLQLPPAIHKPGISPAYCLEISPDHEKNSEMWWLTYDSGMALIPSKQVDS